MNMIHLAIGPVLDPAHRIG